MNKKVSKWMSVAALLMFVTATFQIADDRILPGIVFFGAAVCFVSAADLYRKKEKKEEQERVNNE